jgi:hypothetical protein
MWSIPIRKYSAATQSAKRGILRSESGQGILEYVLVLVVVVTIFLFIARPYMAKLGPRFQDVFKGGIFKDDSSGNGFYYFPVK